MFNKEAQKSQEEFIEEEMMGEQEKEEPALKGTLFLVLGGILIILFSSPFINSVVAIASEMQINSILLAFFLAPIASEAPEILESISLSRKGNSQNINIAFSNLIGGTITKTTLLCSVSVIVLYLFLFHLPHKKKERQRVSDKQQRTIGLDPLLFCQHERFPMGVSKLHR